MKYRAVLVDPPWAKTDKGGNAKPRNWSSVDVAVAGERYRRLEHYRTMSYEELAALPVSDLADERAHLWLWSMNSTMETAYKLVRAWEFEPLGIVTWRKVGKEGRQAFGMGLYFRLSSEQLIFAVRGSPSIYPDKAWLGSVVDGPRTTHSAKPEIFYDLIEHVSEGPYLELFARRRRFGWESWGDEIDSDLEVANG